MNKIKKIEIKQVRLVDVPTYTLLGFSSAQINWLRRSGYPNWYHSPPIKLDTAGHPSIHIDVLRGALIHTPMYC